MLILLYVLKKMGKILQITLLIKKKIIIKLLKDFSLLLLLLPPFPSLLWSFSRLCNT